MAPPTYNDLDKTAKELIDKGYFFNTCKLEAKVYTASDWKFRVQQVIDTKKSKITGLLEAEYKLKKYGMKFLVKTANDGTITSENTIEDRLVDGLKLSLDGSVNPFSGYKKGQFKTKYKTDFLNATMDIDTDLYVKGSFTTEYKGYVFGYFNAYDTKKGKLLGNNFAVARFGQGYSVNASINNQQEISTSVYHKVSNNLQTVAGIGWSAPLTSPALKLGCRYSLSKDTALKMKVNHQGLIGLSLQQCLQDGLFLTLSAQVDGTNIPGGGHAVGLAVEYN